MNPSFLIPPSLLICFILTGACKAAGDNPKTDWREFHEITMIKTGEAVVPSLKDTSAEITLPPRA